jgi:hypothetical protein
MALYRNNHDGTFTDVTQRTGLNIPMFGLGCAIGDYDNDGWDDIYITNYGGNILFHNDHGVFHDETAHAKVGGYGHWSSSAMWIDYDNDGFLDLFCANYCYWTAATDVYCTVDGKVKAICTPAYYSGDHNQLFRNNHDGTFSDVSKQAGLKEKEVKALGVMMIDYDNDGWTDIFVANDQVPNQLLHNEHGTFRDVGVEAGIAFDEGGNARAGMGIDWADADRDGKPTIMIGNFTGEMDWVYKNVGNGVFIDKAPSNGIGTVSLPYNTFGLVQFDYDLDGWPDMFCVNGQVRPEETQLRNTTYAMAPTLFRNQGDGKYEEVGLQYMKGPFEHSIVGRGACYGDFNNDGSLDLLAIGNNTAPMLLKSHRANTNHYLRITLEGTRSNRNGIGAMVYANVGSMRMMDMMKSGSSYQSANEKVITLGLGQSTRVDELIVKWNCGTIDTLRNIPADRMITIKEGSGIQ